MRTGPLSTISRVDRAGRRLCEHSSPDVSWGRLVPYILDVFGGKRVVVSAACDSPHAPRQGDLHSMIRTISPPSLLCFQQDVEVSVVSAHMFFPWSPLPEDSLVALRRLNKQFSAFLLSRGWLVVVGKDYPCVRIPYGLGWSVVRMKPVHNTDACGPRPTSRNRPTQTEGVFLSQDCPIMRTYPIRNVRVCGCFVSIDTTMSTFLLSLFMIFR